MAVPRLALGAAVAAGACTAVLKYGGAIQAAQLDAFGVDAGATPWLLPLAKLAIQLAAVVTVGCLVAAAFLVPGERDPGHGRLLLGAQARTWLRIAAVASFAWGAAAVATMALTIADLLAVPVTEAVDADSLVNLAISVDYGRGLATVLALTSVLATACWFVRTVHGAAATAGIAVLASLPPAFSGHAAGASNHQLAVSLMILHVLGAVLWTGGLLALLLGRHHAATAVRRFSRLAGWCLVAVAVSGVASVALRASEWRDFGTPYGVVLLLKIGALTAVAGFGAWHRRVSLPALAAGRRGTFARVVTVETVVLAAAIGLAAGLARTAPPDDPHTAALISTPIRAVLNWSPDPLFLALSLVAIGCYLAGVRRSGRDVPEGHRHSEGWPLSRTVCWIAGWLVVCAATNLQLARAGDHMFLLVEKVQHVAIIVVAPVLLVSGGGVALAMRVVAPSTDHGPREWLDTVLRSRAVLVVSHPAASLGLYAVALYGIYASALYTVSLRSHAGHLASFAAALLIGALLYWPLLGVQPVARALPHSTRLAQLGAATLLQLLFGVALARTTPIAAHTPLWLVASALLVAAVWMVYRTGTAARLDLDERTTSTPATTASAIQAGQSKAGARS